MQSPHCWLAGRSPRYRSPMIFYWISISVKHLIKLLKGCCHGPYRNRPVATDLSPLSSRKCIHGECVHNGKPQLLGVATCQEPLVNFSSAGITFTGIMQQAWIATAKKYETNKPTSRCLGKSGPWRFVCHDYWTIGKALYVVNLLSSCANWACVPHPWHHDLSEIHFSIQGRCGQNRYTENPWKSAPCFRPFWHLALDFDQDGLSAFPDQSCRAVLWLAMLPTEFCAPGMFRTGKVMRWRCPEGTPKNNTRTRIGKYTQWILPDSVTASNRELWALPEPQIGPKILWFVLSDDPIFMSR